MMNYFFTMINIFELYRNRILSSITSLNSSQSGGNRDPPALFVIIKGLFPSIFEK
jgi:hypothetical protein